MGYMHIDNLYKNTEILLFKECYALEKIHGSFAHLQWKDNKIIFFSGGENYAHKIASSMEKKRNPLKNWMFVLLGIAFAIKDKQNQNINKGEDTNNLNLLT